MRTTTDDDARAMRPKARLLPIALFATFAASAALTVIYQDALDPRITFADAEVRARQALANVGYGWASVRVEDGVAIIEGEAPGESERVLAYDVVRRSLRDLMGRQAVIEAVASRLTLNADSVTLAEAALQRERAAAPRALAEAHAAHATTAAAPVDTGAASKPMDTAQAAQTATAAPAPPADPGQIAQAPPSSVPAEAQARQTTAQAHATPEAPPPAATTAAIETASLDQPAKREETAPQAPAAHAAAPVQTQTAALAAPAPSVAQAAPATEKKAINAVADCKAEFSDALASASIVFDKDKATIDKRSRPLLDTLAAIARRCAKFRLVVEGHTDLNGARTHNLALSKKRAEAVRWALVDRGVDMDHISAEGLGAARPLEKATSESANARNRRIEFSVLEPGSSAHKAASAADPAR